MNKIKGFIPKKKRTELTGKEVAEGFIGVPQVLNDLKELKNDVMEVVDAELTRIETVIEKVTIESEKGLKNIESKVLEFDKTAAGLITHIHNIPTIKGLPGKDADEQKIVETVIERLPDEEKFIAQILSYIPPALDEKALIQRVISKIPENKASLKIIQEKFETDPMSVIDKIMALPAGKFKLKEENIDGLEQTIAAFRSQLSRGYLHGGGQSVTIETSDGTVRISPLKTLKVTNGTLTDNGNGIATLNTGGGGGSPGGANTQFQYNNTSSFGGTLDGIFDNTTNNTKFGFGITDVSDLSDAKVTVKGETSPGTITDVSIDEKSPGTGYTIGNILTLDGGDGNATVQVINVDGDGALTEISLISGGTGYENNSYGVTGGTGVDALIAAEILDPNSIQVWFDGHQDTVMELLGNGNLQVNLNLFVGGGIEVVNEASINGLVNLNTLQTGGSAPVTSGTIKMVISDENGLLSFADIPASGGTPGSPNYSVQYNEAEGSILTSEIQSNGSGYTVNDVISLTGSDAQITVDSVDGGGEVLTYTVTNPGTNVYPTNLSGQNPFGYLTTGGSGTNFRLNVLSITVLENEFGGSKLKFDPSLYYQAIFYTDDGTDATGNAGMQYLLKIGNGKFGSSGQGGSYTLITGDGTGVGGGGDYLVRVGNGGASGNTDGGNIFYFTGNGGSGDGNAGNFTIQLGAGIGAGSDGHFKIINPFFLAAIFDTSEIISTDKTFTLPSQTGTFILNPINGDTGTAINILAGHAVSIDTDGGPITIQSGDSTGANAGAPVSITGGLGGATAIGGQIYIQGGPGGLTSGKGGPVNIQGGPAVGTNSDGGNVIIVGGGGTGAGVNGFVKIGVPTTSDGAILSTSSLTADRTFTFLNNTGILDITTGHARATAQTAANTNVLTVAVGGADGTFQLLANVLVTTSTAHSFGVTVDYTDESNVARTLTIPVAQLAGTLITAITNVTGAGPYEGVALTIRAKSGTNIVFKTAGTFTTVTYNVDCSVIQVA